MIYKVLITGENSHIGNKIQNWLLAKNPDLFQVSQLDVVSEKWKECDFSRYDVIIHVAAIVHQPDCKDWDLYKKVNIDLPVDIANRAKQAGVKQFIFFSSMAVYGIGKVLTNESIHNDTKENPQSMYGKSKWMAEKKLIQLEDGHFSVIIVRPPNVYGENGSRGYVITFAKLVKRLPVLPVAFEGIKQSMIYIDNLTELIRLIIINNKKGCYMPQDNVPVSTVELITAISSAINKKIYKSKFLGVFVRLFSFIPIIKKAYGGISYDVSLSTFQDLDYVVVPFNEGIRRCLLSFNK